MKASQLIAALRFKTVQPDQFTDFDVTALTQDTRQVVTNAVFICVSGYHVDGHDLAADAVAKGAKLVIAEKPITVNAPVVYV